MSHGLQYSGVAVVTHWLDVCFSITWMAPPNTLANGIIIIIIVVGLTHLRESQIFHAGMGWTVPP